MSDRFEFGPFAFDASTPVLWRGGEVVPLPPKALALLAALVAERGQVVSKRELMARVWPDTFVAEANLSVTVATLRKALGQRPEGGLYVETLPRRGYRFGAPLRAPAGAPRLRLAVLPFRDLAPGAEAHLGLGMADALITRLTGLEPLRVRPTGAVVEYLASPRPPLVAAAELGVDAVLDGVLQRTGDRLAVSVQLVPRVPAVKPWADRFEGDLSDVFALQDVIAGRVAEALASRIPSAPGPPAHRPAFPAYEAYLRGRFLLARFELQGLGSAFGNFAEAVQLDPRYAAPRAGLADAHLLRSFAGPDPPDQALRLAAECAEEALALDPGAAEAHVSRGLVALFARWDWPAAEAGFGRALEMGSPAPAIRFWHALLLALAGDAAAARREIALGREVDPISPFAGVVLAFLHEIGQDVAHELAVARRNAELHPHRVLCEWRLGLALLRAGRAAGAVAPLRRAVEGTAGGPAMRAALARALVGAGRVDEAQALLAEMEAAAATTYFSPYQRATVLLALGRQDTALDRLDEAVETRDPWVVFLRTDSALAAVRDAPRVAALAARVFATAPRR